MKSTIGYFPHDFNSRNDERILEIREKWGASGYAWFFMLCEIMAENDDGCLDMDRLGGYSLSMAMSKTDLQAFITDCKELKLLVPAGANKVTSNRMQSHKESRKAMSRGAKAKAQARVKAPTTPIQVPAPTPTPEKPPIRVPLLQTDGTPRQQLHRHKPTELEFLRVRYSEELTRAGTSWNEVLDKWNDTLMGENKDFAVNDNERHKQLHATLSRYLISWVSNSKDKKHPKPQTEYDLKA